MSVMWPILAILGLGFFVIGTVVGSFLNVCIYRIPWQKSVIWPGSRCPVCFSAIAARDNVPVISWIALRGECRDCGTSISVRYLLVEILVGFLFLGAYLLDVVPWDRGDLGTDLPDSTGGGCLPRRVPGTPRRGDLHRLRLVGDPQTNHRYGHGRRNCAGDDLASGSTRAGGCRDSRSGVRGRLFGYAGRSRT